MMGEMFGNPRQVDPIELSWNVLVPLSAACNDTPCRLRGSVLPPCSDMHYGSRMQAAPAACGYIAAGRRVGRLLRRTPCKRDVCLDRHLRPLELSAMPQVPDSASSASTTKEQEICASRGWGPI
jgi:hypothetical protein